MMRKKGGWATLCFLAAFLVFSGEKETDSLRASALRGEAESQFVLGSEYFFGRNGRKVQPTLAFFWFRKAALQGHAEALYNLGACHEHGWGTEPSPARAFDCYSQAAEKKLSAARLRRALLLFRGVPEEPDSEDRRFAGTPASPAIALNELRRLGSEGYAPARIELAKILFGNRNYMREHGAEVRKLLAEEVKKPSVSPEVLRLYAVMLRRGAGGIADFEGAVRMLRRGVAKNDAESIYLLAQVTENGEGCAPDRAAALKLYRRAEAMGHAGAILRIGEFYLLGDLLPHDPVKAFDCFRRAAGRKFPRGCFQLGEALFYGVGVEPDKALAVESFDAGARLGDADCQYRLAQCLFAGDGGAPDVSGALFWLKRAAASGHREAVRELGNRLLEGRGVQCDPLLGRRLLESLDSAGEERKRPEIEKLF